MLKSLIARTFFILAIAVFLDPALAWAADREPPRRDIELLIQNLTPRRDTSWPTGISWSAGVRLQHLGEPAIEALITNLQRDPFADDFHVNHSPTMKVLEKIGTSAIPALHVTLTDTLIRSRKDTDVRFAVSLVMILGRIDRVASVPDLVRVVHLSKSIRLRRVALLELLGEAAFYARIYFGALPQLRDVSSPFGEAIAPLLPLLHEAAVDTDSDVRCSAGRLLFRWGSGYERDVGESALISVFETGRSYFQKKAVIALAAAGGETMIRRFHAWAAGAPDETKMEISRALFGLEDTGYIELTRDLLDSGDARIRCEAINLARHSRNTVFIPVLIDHLTDTGLNGGSSTSGPRGAQVTVRYTLALDAHEALRRLTFQNIDSEPERWRSWWSETPIRAWEGLLHVFLSHCMDHVGDTEPYVQNEWMHRLSEAPRPEILPFLRAYLHNPKCSPYAASSGSYRSGGVEPVIILLTNLAAAGNTEARSLLFDCFNTPYEVLQIPAACALATFDRRAGIESLASFLDDTTSVGKRRRAAYKLLEFGDTRAIPTLIEELEDNSSSSRERAIRSLRLYTQQDIPFDPAADEVSRRAAVRSWRDWWRTNKRTLSLKVAAAFIDQENYR